ncbi:MAG: putative rane-associated, metal-dependent hydrolase [Firmicutes bacterium]|nr:putative rane-associated, metal-dependent hydrolase [Bacillota bacterium]
MKLQKFANAIQNVFHENVGFIVTLFLLNFTTMAWSLISEQKLEVMISYGFSLFFAAFGVAAFVQILYNPILKNLVKAAILAITGVIFVIEFFAMYNYKILIGAGIVNSIFETNYREMVEFFEMYLGFKECIGVLGLLTIIYFVKKKNFTFCKVSHTKPNKVVMGILAIGFLYTIRMVSVYGEFFTDHQYLPIQRAYASAQVAIKNMEAYNNLTSRLNDKIELTENNSKIKNVVFILGESTNRNHMGLYGYPLPNTPNLQRMQDEHNLYTFRDVISPHSTTIAVLSELLTFCHLESDKNWYEYNNIVDVMNAAGYKTFWLSNQESSGIWGNVAQIFAQHSSKHEFTRIRDSREDYGVVDGELFPLIDRAMQERADKNFFVIHLMGEHGLYYNRFPYAFSKFNKDDVPLNVDDDKKTIVAQYDNAIYYNDYIVSSIIDKFKDDETLVIYVSDHGEAVYDESSFSGHIEENPNRHMIEIPMLMWASDKFKEQYPEKVQRISKALNRPYMTDDMIHTVLDLTDIKTADYEAKRSIINDQFDSTRKRIFNKKDYDLEIKNGEVAKSE